MKPVTREWLLATLRGLVREEARGTLLVIDDDEASRYILRGLLADTRFLVLEAADGASGLAQARASRPDGIFLDLVMPGMSGQQFLEARARDPELARIPVIVSTSRVLDERERAALEAVGVVDIVPKESPSRDAAVKRVRDALERAGLVAALAAAEGT